MKSLNALIVFMEHSNVPGVLYVSAFLPVKHEVEMEQQSCHWQNRCEPARKGDRPLVCNMYICGPVSAIVEVHQHRQNCDCRYPSQIRVTISLADLRSLLEFIPAHFFPMKPHKYSCHIYN